MQSANKSIQYLLDLYTCTNLNTHYHIFDGLQSSNTGKIHLIHDTFPSDLYYCRWITWKKEEECSLYEPSREKTNIIASALFIDSDQADTFRLRGYRVMIPETKIHRRRKVYIRVSLCGMLKLIRVDTLRRVLNVGFIAERLIC